MGFNMKFFKFIYGLIKSIGFIFILFIVSLFITSFAYYDHIIGTTNEKENLSIYQSEKVKSFSSYGEDQLNIDIAFKEETSNYYKMMYAYYYFDLKKIPVQTFFIEENIIITIDKNGILVWMKV